MWNSFNFIRVLNSCHRVHFLRWLPITQQTFFIRISQPQSFWNKQFSVRHNLQNMEDTAKQISILFRHFLLIISFLKKIIYKNCCQRSSLASSKVFIRWWPWLQAWFRGRSSMNNFRHSVIIKWSLWSCHSEKENIFLRIGVRRQYYLDDYYLMKFCQLLIFLILKKERKVIEKRKNLKKI